MRAENWHTFCIISIILTVANAFAFITPGGYSGYSYTPTPNSLDKGELGYSARLGLVGGNALSHAIAMRPVSFLELGFGIGKEPVLATKIILPFFDSLPQSAAIGVSGKRWYFTGMLQSGGKTSYNLTVAGIYDMDLHSSVGSVAGEADFGYASISVENFLYRNRYGAASIFTLKPFTVFDVPSYIELSAGGSWRSPEKTEGFAAFASVQVKAPLVESEKEPIVYLDVNPVFDHSASFARNVYALRLGVDIDAAIAAPFDFYLVGGFSPYLSTKNQERLARRDLFDRCYLLWDSDNSPSWFGAGMLNSGIFGFQWQLAKRFYNPSPLALTLGYTVGEQKGVNAVAQVPLHPRMHRYFSKSLLFAEGGLFLGERLAAQLNFRQGTEKKHLQIGSGYDFENKSIFGELSLQYDFSISKRVSGLEFRVAPNLRHRENSPFYVFDYDVPIYQEGNNNRRLRSFPWKK